METLFNKWIEKEKRVSRAKKRRYPHFDPKINFSQNISFFRSFLNNVENVAKHSFYPFIRMELVTPRYKKTEDINENGKAVRKITKKIRPLAYASHFDAYIYSYYSTLLTDRYEKKLNRWGIYENVLAYLEKGKSNIEFAHEVFDYIKNKGECVAFAFDISSFFDGLDHEHLKLMWSRVLNKKMLPVDHFKVYKSLTDYTYVEKTELEKEFPHLIANQKLKIPTLRICEPLEFREKIRNKGLISQNPFTIKIKSSTRFGLKCGIPQGSPISACLSNIYMIEFDIRTKEKIDSLDGIYRRYCDDIIVVVGENEKTEAKNFILNEIIKYHLEINEEKTDIRYFRKNVKGDLRSFDESHNYRNLQYLGFEFNGRNTYIRSSSMSRYYTRLTSRIRENLKAAYGSNSIGSKIFRKKLYNRYTEKGERNFITYAKRAMEHMDSETINCQYKNSMQKVKKRLNKKKTKFEEKLKEKGRFTKEME